MTYPARSGTQLRNAELAQIHVAKKQLGLDDETYRAVLWTVGRVRSAGDLDWTGRKTLLDHFKAFEYGFVSALQTYFRNPGIARRLAELMRPMPGATWAATACSPHVRG